MSDSPKKQLCCVCKVRPVCGCNWFPVCGDKACNAIYHICFSAVADGACHAKNETLENLQSAFNYLMKSPRSQKTLRLAVAREISKRLKSQTVNRKS